MDAKTLRDLFRSGDSYLVTSYRGEAGSIKEADNLILRALDLLARTEESTDELVRELRDQADEERQFEYPERAKLLDMAAAAIVALKAERDELKRHAEAMAEELQWIACRYDDSKSTRECAADAYEMKSAAAQALHAYRATQEKS